MITQLFTAGPFWSNPLLQSTVCIVVGLIGSLLLRRRSARAHQVLFLAMIAAVAVPVMSMIVRHYELGIFVDKPAVTKSRLSEIHIVPIATSYEISALPAIQNTYPPPAIEPEYAMPATAVVREAKAKLPLSTILTWSWIIVSTILACRLFMTFILGIRMLRRMLPLRCEKIRKALCIAKDKLGIDKPVQVLAGNAVSSPVIWCWSRKPALLLPDDAEQFEDRVDWVGMFCHELAHFRRLDHISGLFAEMMVCIFPWHPLMWWAKSRLAGLSEQACDDWVVAGSRSPADYAESLLDLSPQGQLSFLPAVVGRKNGLENRIRRIVKDKCGKPHLGLCWAVVVTLIAACITIGAAFAQTRPADTDQAKDECEELLAEEHKHEQHAKEHNHELLAQEQLLFDQQQELLAEEQQLKQLSELLKLEQFKQKKNADTTEQNPAATHGVFMGHKWRIDKNHLIWWNDKPYVRYGFTGNGSMDRFIELGFNQFNVCPSEELWVFSKSRTDNMEAIRQVNQYTDELVKRGATYYVGLNPLWPWKGSGKITQDDMVESLFKMTWNVTEFSGRKHDLRLSTTTERESQFNKSKMRAYLFDMEAGKREEISATLKNIITSSEEIRESPTEVTEATKHTFIFEKMQLPISRDLRVTIVLPFHTEMVPQVYPSSFPALWKPTIARYYRKGLTSFSKALAKEGLRGMMFGDEINSYRVTFPNAEVYVNFNGDEVALHAYRDWLKKKYRKIDELNGYLGTKYDNFGQVNWHICIYPFLEEELEDEDPWKGIKNTFGLFASASQMRKIDELQEDFRVWFYGHWLAEYGKMAKEIIGNVPVFITSAGIGGDADNYLQIHKQAMLEGLDGLVRNHYAYVKKSQAGRFDTFEVWSDRRFPLETVTSLLDSVQKEGGKTKTYMSNEFGCPKKGGHDDFGLGDQFSFQSKDDLRNFLHVLIENGYKGFNMFKMNPNVETAQEEVKWLSELKGEIVKDTIARTNCRKEIRITAKEAIRVARQVPKLKSLIKRYPNVRPSAAFNDRYGVWVVEFVSDNREVGFASISSDGRVLEVETK